jgi:hypothetical protein
MINIIAFVTLFTGPDTKLLSKRHLIATTKQKPKPTATARAFAGREYPLTMLARLGRIVLVVSRAFSALRR